MSHRPPSLVELMRALGRGWCTFLGAAEHGETLVLSGASLGIGGEPFADMNWAYVHGPDDVARDVRGCVDALRARRLPGVISAATTTAATIASLVDELGLAVAGHDPLMCVRAADARRAETAFEVRRVTDLAGVLAAGEVLGDAYGLPAEWCQMMLGTGFPQLEDADVFMSGLNGRAMAVAGTGRSGDVVGVYAVGTRVAHRRRGAASAAVSAAIDYHVARGARWCALLSEPAAEPLYAGLGFVVVDHAATWTVEVA